jgi:hypothetical protein
MNTVEAQLVDSPAPPLASRSGWDTVTVLGGVLTVALTAIFFGSLFNRFITIHDNWQNYYAQMMRQGQMPYRDFYFFTQPLSLFLGYVFSGDHLINLRLFGVAERMVLAALLYFLLSREFSPLASFLGAFVSTMAFASERLDGFFVYTVDCLVFLIAGLICLYQAQKHPHWQRGLLVLAGTFGSLAFFSKQSTGLFAMLALALLLVWLSPRFAGVPRSLTFLFLGSCIPAVPIIFWLVINGAWQPYLDQVFRQAAASKGGLAVVLFKSLQLAFGRWTFVLFGIVMAPAFIGGWRRRPVLGRPGLVEGKGAIVITATLATGIIIAATFHPAGNLQMFLILLYTDFFPRVVFLALAIAFLLAVIRRVRTPTPQSQHVTAMLLVAGILWAYSTGMSHVADPYAVIFAVAYFMASACDTLRSRAGTPLLGVVAALGLFQIGETAWQKYSDPYDWNGWRSTYSHGSASSHWPQLAGFKLDQSTVDFFDTVLDDIAQNSRPGEPIFTFPTIPLFNFIPGRPQPTFCAVFYWDVCPDSVAEADAVRVRAARPAIIVDLDLDEWVWVQVEEVFRGGRRSGQRSIQEAIRQMTSSGDYRLLHSLKTPFYKMPLNVWKRVK